MAEPVKAERPPTSLILALMAAPPDGKPLTKISVVEGIIGAPVKSPSEYTIEFVKVILSLVCNITTRSLDMNGLPP